MITMMLLLLMLLMMIVDRDRIEEERSNAEFQERRTRNDARFILNIL